MADRRVNRLRQIIFGPNHRWWALSVAALATFMVTTDAGLLSISLPVIVAEFHVDLAVGGWLPFIYALVTGSLYLPCGRLSDLLGRKQTLSAGFLIFTVTALMAGFSQSIGQVIFFRGLQAAGSALMMANTFALVTALFSPAERGRAMGISGGMISALGFVIGPALGGLITYTMGWRSVFYVSFGLGIVGLLGARFILLDEKARAAGATEKQPFDFVGTATFALSLTALLLALTAGQKGLWHAPIVLSELVTATLSLAFFLWWEKRTPHPLLDLGLFRIRLFAAGNVARLASFVTVSMNQLIMPFFLQLGLGFDTLRAGLFMATASVGLGVLSPVTGWLSDRIGARLLMSSGLGLMGISFLSLRSLDLGASTADIVLRLGLLGIGYGLFQTPNNNSLMSSIPPDRLGVGSSFLSIVRSLGISIGVATASAIVSSRLVAVTGQTSLDALRSAAASESTGNLLSAFMQGYRTTCLTAAVLCFIGALAATVRAPQREK